MPSNATELWTAAEVAEWFRVTPAWVYANLDSLPCLKIGRRVRFDAAKIRAMISTPPAAPKKDEGDAA